MDATLVGRVRHGDHDAFEELYRTHVRAVRTVVSAKLSGVDAVADVVQEVFARALERLSTLREPDHFRAWLLSIVRHAAIDQRRDRDKTRHSPGEEAEAQPEPGDGPADLVELAELSELVNGLVGGLSTRDATAISLVTRLGFSPAEVAQALGVTPGAAKVIVHRARRRLRDALSLDLMVRRSGEGCPAFAEVYDREAPAAAAHHVHGCSTCADLASRDIELFSFSSASVVEPDDSHAALP